MARFYLEEFPDRAKITMTIADALHYSPEQRQQIIDSYPAHEREARTLGIPTLGSGLIFPVLEENIICEPIPIPRHWPQIGGIDFGWDHPSSACRPGGRVQSRRLRGWGRNRLSGQRELHRRMRMYRRRIEHRHVEIALAD